MTTIPTREMINDLSNAGLSLGQKALLPKYSVTGTVRKADWDKMKGGGELKVSPIKEVRTTNIVTVSPPTNYH
jgi:hypothetical protein